MFAVLRAARVEYAATRYMKSAGMKNQTGPAGGSDNTNTGRRERGKTMNINNFADLVYKETREKYEKFFQDTQYKEGLVEGASAVKVIPGKKYTKVDVGSSGKYMVDTDGNIWGIKAYGVVHRGHKYGTLDTINEWHWGEYTATRKTA